MERGKEASEPTTEDLEKTRLYFAELEDALKHYSSDFSPGMHKTLSLRSDAEGNPIMEWVSQTRFPALDDLPEHLEKLRSVANQLDSYPPNFWIQYYQRRQEGEPLPYIALQVISFGQNNQQQSTFKTQAEFYAEHLRNFSWAGSRHPDFSRDCAEQCYRYIDAHLKIKELI